jgi:hypothetical protein
MTPTLMDSIKLRAFLPFNRLMTPALNMAINNVPPMSFKEKFAVG